MSLTSSNPNSDYGEAVTLTAELAATLSWQPTPTGSVTFFDGSNVLGDAPLSSGRAAFATATLTAGNHTLLAAYSGDSNFQPHRGTSMNQSVNLGQDFSISAPSTTDPAVISAGQSTTATITWASLNGFAGSVALTCSVSPAPSRAPTCSLNPASISPSATGATSTLTVKTTGATASLIPPGLRHDLRPFYALLLPVSGCAFLGIGLATGGVIRRRLLGLLLAGLLAASLSFQVACGGGTSNSGGKGSPGTPAGNYTVTVIGTSGSGTNIVTREATLTITVQ
jgi:hypothetical protein